MWTLGAENNSERSRFDLRDLGLVGGPPLRGADTVTKLAADLLRTDCVALLIFDDVASSIFARAVSDGRTCTRMLPLATSIAEMTRSEGHAIVMSDVVAEMPEAMEAEAFEARAILSVPVFGPDIPPAGVLAAIQCEPRDWTAEDLTRMENLAYLVSQEIILRASFETLRIMSRDTSEMLREALH